LGFFGGPPVCVVFRFSRFSATFPPPEFFSVKKNFLTLLFVCLFFCPPKLLKTFLAHSFAFVCFPLCNRIRWAFWGLENPRMSDKHGKVSDYKASGGQCYAWSLKYSLRKKMMKLIGVFASVYSYLGSKKLSQLWLRVSILWNRFAKICGLNLMRSSLSL
jgi:hypothetical protein